jgi:hypothetical protein
VCVVIQSCPCGSGHASCGTPLVGTGAQCSGEELEHTAHPLHSKVRRRALASRLCRFRARGIESVEVDGTGWWPSHTLRTGRCIGPVAIGPRRRGVDRGNLPRRAPPVEERALRIWHRR